MQLAFTNKSVPTQYVPTSSGSFTADMTVGEKKVHLLMWDTAGSEALDHMRPTCYAQAEVVIICYAIDNRASFDNVRTKVSEYTSLSVFVCWFVCVLC